MEIQLNSSDRQAIAEEIISVLKAHIEQLVQLQSAAATPTPAAVPAPKTVDGALTIKGAAEFLNVTERWIRRQIADRTIKHFTVGRQIRFKKVELEKYVQAREVLPPQHIAIPVYLGERSRG